MQEEPRYQALRLPYLRPSARLDDAALEHLVALFAGSASCRPRPPA